MRITRESLETLLAQNASLGLGLAGSILTARLLGPAGKGMLTWLLLWPALVVVVGRLGLDTATTYYGRSDPASLAAHRKLLVPVTLVLGIGLSVIFLGVAHLSGGGEELASSDLLILALAAGPAGLYTALSGGLLLGSGRVRSFNLLVLLVPFLSSAGVFLLWVVRPEWVDVRAALATWVAAHLMTAAAGRLLLPRAAPCHRPSHWPLARRALSYGLRVHLGGLAAHLNLRLSQFLIGAFGGATALGLYSAALTLSELLAYFAVAESLVLLPAASALPPHCRWALVKERTRRTLGLFGIASLVALYLLRPAVVIVLGPAFLGLIPVFYGLLPGMAAHSMNLLLGTGLRAAGDPMAPSRAACLGLALGVGAAPLILSQWDILGAAFLFSATQIASCAYLVRAARRSERALAVLAPDRPIPRTVALPARALESVETRRAIS